MKKCDACGNSTNIGIGMGGAFICRQCDPDVREEIDKLREDGKAVNVAHIARRLYRETHSAGNYLLRDIPKDLWDAAKHRAVDENTNLRDLVLTSLKAYLDRT